MHSNRFVRSGRAIAAGVTVALAMGATVSRATAQWHHEASMFRGEVGIEQLGRAIAIDGDVAVLGSGADTHQDPSAEAAFVYRFDGDAWIEEAMIVVPDGVLGDRFGQAVAIGGDLLVVGAWGDDDVGRDAGAAYVYRRRTATRTWGFDEKLTVPRIGAGANFGWSVATDGVFVFVGAPGHDGATQGVPRLDTGGVWCFAEEPAPLPDDGLTWTVRERWTGAMTDDRLGAALAARHGLAVAGMPGATDGTGFALVLLAQSDGTWTTDTIAATDGAPGSGFGSAVGTDGRDVIVGAPTHRHAQVSDEPRALVESGTAYVFGRVGAAWIERTALRPPGGGAPGDRFGAAVGLDGDLAAVGAPGDDRGAADAGAGYLFRFNRVAWALDHAILPTATDEAFGAALGVHGTVCMVAAPRCKTGAFRSGVVTVHRCAYVLGRTPLSRTGHAMSCTGDLDEDGFDDLLVGAPLHGDGDGRLYVFSGRTRAPIDTLEGAHGEGLGRAVAGIGDVDGDGREDFIVGAPFHRDERGRVKVFSGRDGSRLFTKRGEAAGDRFGWAVAGGLDVDADGRLDILVGAPRNADAGHMAGKVYVYDGQTGREIGSVAATARGERFGYALAALGRANGDRFHDFVVGAPYDSDRAFKAGRVDVISGRTLDRLYVIHGRGRTGRFGRALAVVGLVDDDNRTDFAVGSPTFDPTDRPNAGRIDVFSGRDGSRLWSRRGRSAGDRFGHAVAGIPDVNGDDRDDLLVGAPRHDGSGRNAGRSSLYSGADGALLGRFAGERPFDSSGYALACVRDLDDDGRHEALVGAPYGDAAGPRAGKVQVLMSSGAATAVPVADDHAADAIAALDYGDGDAAELVTLLAQWGDCDACENDVNGDGHVDAADLVSLLRGLDE